MAQWRKIIVSGSSAVLNEISASGAIVPKADNGSDLGSSTLEWKNLYIDGTANIDSLVLNSGATVTAVLDQDTMSSDSATSLSTQQSIKAYVDSQVTAQDLDFQGDSGGALSIDLDSETLDIAGDGAGISTVGSGNQITISGDHDALTNFVSDEHIAHSGVTLTAGDGLTGGGTIAASRTFTVVGGDGITANADEIVITPAQTTITSIYATDLILGEDSETAIDFGTANEIDFKINDTTELTLDASALYPTGDAGLDLGTTILEFKDAFFDGTVTSDAFAGPLTGEVTGNASTATKISSITNNNIVQLTSSQTLTNKILTTPAIASFTNATHNHSNTAGGGQITLGTGTTGNYVSTAVAGSGIDVSGATGNVTISIGTGEVVNAMIGDNEVNSEHYAAGSIDNEHLADDAVDSAELKAGSVDDAHLAGSISNAKLSNSSLTYTAGTGLTGGGAVSLGGSATLNVIGGNGITANSDDVAVTAAQTTITSVKNNSLVVGRVSPDDTINFGSGDVTIEIGGSEKFGVTSAGVDITGVLTTSGNLTVGGDLDVNGTVTTIDTANSYIADKFMIIASGSVSDTDGGIIVQNHASKGYALGYDAGVDRWALQVDLAHNATALVPDAYVGVVQFGAANPDTQSPTPTYGGTTNGIGTIYVDTNDNEIWIYA